MQKIGRNQPCPCGSGKKWKRCCLLRADGVRFTREERVSAWEKLQAFISGTVGPEYDAAWEELWGRWADRVEGLDPTSRRWQSRSSTSGSPAIARSTTAGA